MTPSTIAVYHNGAFISSVEVEWDSIPEFTKYPDGSVLIRPKPKRWTIDKSNWDDVGRYVTYVVSEDGKEVGDFQEEGRAQEYVDWQNSKEQSNG